jgi:hypothetical protein
MGGSAIEGEPMEPAPKTRIRRQKKLGRYDRETIDRILDFDQQSKKAGQIYF